MFLEKLRFRESVPVFKGDAPAGVLSRTSHGAEFVYDDFFRKAELERASYGVCFGLSPDRDRHTVAGTNLHPFFAGLLPEGLRLKALRQVTKTSEDDLFSMLLAMGRDCIGDVTVRLDDDDPISIASPPPSEVSFLELFRESINSRDLRLRNLDPGVPGVIPKISAAMISFPVSFRQNRKHYLLKLPTDDHPRIIENEHFFMQAARNCGFDVASTRIVSDREGVAGLLVERFDRRYDNETKEIVRLHQEDACQFLDRYPQDKYRISLREIATRLEQICNAPILEIHKLIELYLFCYLIGNGDMHAKNISVVESVTGFRLSPAYDLLSTLPYGDKSMALLMGPKNENFTAKDFIEFGRMFQIPEKAVRSSLARLVKRLAPWIARSEEIGFAEKKFQHLKATFEMRANKLLD